MLELEFACLEYSSQRSWNIVQNTTYFHVRLFRSTWSAGRQNMSEIGSDQRVTFESNRVELKIWIIYSSDIFRWNDSYIFSAADPALRGFSVTMRRLPRFILGRRSSIQRHHTIEISTNSYACYSRTPEINQTQGIQFPRWRMYSTLDQGREVRSFLDREVNNYYCVHRHIQLWSGSHESELKPLMTDT